MIVAAFTSHRLSPLSSCRQWLAFGAVILSGMGLLACSNVPVVGGLKEEDATRVLVALDRSNVDSTKEADPIVEGKFQVLVSREDAGRAAAILQDEELPPRSSPGVLDAVGKSSLVPSSLAEHAHYIAGIAGDIEHTLTEVDGVLSARVHLSVPAPDPLGERPHQAPSASVLLKYRGSTPPIDGTSIQHLVVGAVGGMRVDDVSVVLVGRPRPALGTERQLVRLGPINVARTSLPLLRRAIVGVILAFFVLLGSLGWMWMKLRKAYEKSA